MLKRTRAGRPCHGGVGGCLLVHAPLARAGCPCHFGAVRSGGVGVGLDGGAGGGGGADRFGDSGGAGGGVGWLRQLGEAEEDLFVGGGEVEFDGGGGEVGEGVVDGGPAGEA